MEDFMAIATASKKALEDMEKALRKYEEDGVTPTDGAVANMVGLGPDANPFEPGSDKALWWNYRWGHQQSVKNGGC